MSDRPSDEERQPFDYEAIREVVRQKDTATLAQFLEAAKKQATPLPAGARGETLLHAAASEADYQECLALMLHRGKGVLDVDAATDEGATALYVACDKGLDESALLLLQAGCNPTSGAAATYSPLHAATKNGHSKTVEYLLDFGANIDEQDGRGNAPLHVAAGERNMEMCRLLLEKGASVAVENDVGRVPLHLMLGSRNFVDSLFVWNYADFGLLNRRDHDGVTPFMRAVLADGDRGVEYLLENAAPNVELYSHRPPKAVLHLAAEYGCENAFLHLLDAIDVAEYRRYCTSQYPFSGAPDDEQPFMSLTNCVLKCTKSLRNLRNLLASDLPKSVLQMPTVLYYYCYGIEGEAMIVYAPVTCCKWIAPSFSTYAPTTEFIMDCLPLLIEHGVLTMDEFKREFRVTWPPEAVFFHPFANIYSTHVEVAREKRTNVTRNSQPLFDVFCENGVTTDFCLQSYHDTGEPFATFGDYLRYYKVVTRAVRLGHIEAVKALMSNSVILEPEKVLVCSVLQERNADELEQGHPDTYLYLIGLKPVYYMREQLRQSCGVDYWCNLRADPREEFAEVTLQQLCRTAIRGQLRDRSLEDNLRNFRAKILGLPLPSSMKDYLLFRS